MVHRQVVVFQSRELQKCLVDLQSSLMGSEDTSTSSGRPMVLKKQDGSWKASSSSSYSFILQLPGLNWPCECSFPSSSSDLRGWSVNGNHQTGILLPYISHPSVQTSVVLGCDSVFSLHGFNRSHNYTSMVHRTFSSDVITWAKTRSRPLHYAWDRVDESVQGHCFNVDDFFIGSGSANVGLNLLIFVLVCSRCVPSCSAIGTNTFIADAASVAAAYHCQATDRADGSLHLSWLVRLSTGLAFSLIADG